MYMYGQYSENYSSPLNQNPAYSPSYNQRPRPYPYPVPAYDPYTYPQNLPMAIELIREAVAGEREDELFYDYMIGIAPSQEDKDIIASIRDDERKHFALFRQIYYELTGCMLPPAADPEFTPPSSYCQGIQKALFGELAAVERYRRILYALQDRVQINKLIEIITDEQKHATKWNYLYSKNECFDEGETD